ncbi:bifunctional tetrahydrofolate synthase/dihydrofolate synthase [Gallaecimonas xiamenensis]|uniref:Dihydrofolate synthase/folylpolyglutamate synthase n=1 Tax=Gallaecimonas xiamenensis 3-C-1 TaxID=745411 RepID=K2J059_9GAMM|nr:bifunctional tetrahydrofolate synthase/dihydrofolate synthase [Gallaecimonas xiamenensis]EKE76241.1 bifunctional folylpolyglutamate synthase/ dihydrofolate synthase [Gallaecimonas xiamenensis 3-C-1]
MTTFSSQSLADWLFHLENLHQSAIDMGLERVKAVAERAQLLPLAAKTLLVGGTNGKGSTCAMMESILRQGGYSVAVYSSPHLVDYRERLRLNQAMLSEEEHCQAFAAIEQARGEISLTYFEFSTLAALWLCKRHQPDVVILEVGLGGRLDATNIVDADVAVVTSIDLDHQSFLGNSRESVAREKIGIARQGRPLVCGEPDPTEVFFEEAARIGPKLCWVGRDFIYEDQGQHWVLEGNSWPRPGLPLPNAATALTALKALGLPLKAEAIASGLRLASLPGRMQQLSDSPLVLCDVAHNPHAARYLNSELKRRFAGRPLHGVCAMLADKDIEGTLAALDSISHWYPAELSGVGRAAPASRLAKALGAAQSYGTVIAAQQAAVKAAGTDGVVIVFGSFYTVAQVLPKGSDGVQSSN